MSTPQKIDLTKAGEIVNDTFSLPEECFYSYSFNFPELKERPINKPEWLLENEDKIWPQSFPVAIKLYLIEKGQKKRLISFSEHKESRTSFFPYTNSYSALSGRFAPGDYMIQIELLKPVTKVADGDNSFTIFQSRCSEPSIRTGHPTSSLIQLEIQRIEIARMAFQSSLSKPPITKKTIFSREGYSLV